MKFSVLIKEGFEKVRFEVELLSRDRLTETWKATSGQRSVELKSNRPQLRNKGLASKRPLWTVSDNRVGYASTIEALKAEILKKADNQ